VAALADVDERRLHRREHVLHPAEVDVAGHRRVGLAADVVLDQDVVLEHPDRGAALTLADDHHPLDALTTGQELGLGDDRASATGFAALASALLLGLEAGRALDALRLVAAGLAHPGHGAGRVVPVGGGPAATTAAATAARRALTVGALVV